MRTTVAGGAWKLRLRRLPGGRGGVAGSAGKQMANLTKRERIFGFVGFLCAIVAILDAVRTYSENALVEFTGTFLGAGLAAGIGVWLLYLERGQTDEDRRDQLLTAFASEVRASKIILRGTSTPIEGSNGKVFGEVVVVSLPSIVVEECARSGLFSSEHTDDFFNLAGHIQVHNAEVSFLQAARTGFVTDRALQAATEEMKKRQCDLYMLYEDWQTRIME